MSSNDARETNNKTKAVVEKVEKLALPRLERALPKSLGFDPRRFLHTAIQAFYKTPQLADCDLTSIVVAMITAAQVGIECDGIHGALVPFKGKANFVPMYQGLMASVQRSGLVKQVRPPRVVYEGDEFSYEYGLVEKMRHVPSDDPDRQTWDHLTHVYCVADMKDGSSSFIVMSRKQILAIRGRSAARSQSPWNTDPIPMAQKSAVRQLCKYLPKSAEDRMLSKLIQLDELADAGVEPADDSLAADVKENAGPKSRGAKIMDVKGRSAPAPDDEPLDLPDAPSDYGSGWNEEDAPRVDDDTGLPSPAAPEPVPARQPAPDPKPAQAAKPQPAPAQAAPRPLPPIPPATVPPKKPAEAPAPRQQSLTDPDPKNYD